MNKIQIADYIQQLMVVSGVVWASTEGFRLFFKAVGKSFNMSFVPARVIIAFVLGPPAAFIAHEAHFIDCGTSLSHTWAVIFFGLLCAMVSAGGHQLCTSAVQHFGHKKARKLTEPDQTPT